eukprot:438711-Pelagomonas_calceolata.AAC.8
MGWVGRPGGKSKSTGLPQFGFSCFEKHDGIKDSAATIPSTLRELEFFLERLRDPPLADEHLPGMCGMAGRGCSCCCRGIV